jgi:hypothetical protein
VSSFVGVQHATCINLCVFSSAYYPNVLNYHNRYILTVLTVLLSTKQKPATTKVQHRFYCTIIQMYSGWD